jgi:hypothetical protein
MGRLNRVGGGEGPVSGGRRRRRRAAVTGAGGKVARSGALDLDRMADGGSGRRGACGEAMARIVGPVTVRQHRGSSHQSKHM